MNTSYNVNPPGDMEKVINISFDSEDGIMGLESRKEYTVPDFPDFLHPKIVKELLEMIREAEQ